MKGLVEKAFPLLLAAGAAVFAAGCGSESDAGDGDPAVIKAPLGEWTWVDFPDTRCMDDSATGLGIRFSDKSDKLLIMIQGGGACFNGATCAIASNPNGFGESNLYASRELTTGLLATDDEDNPFRDWNMVFIPYCSGDIFTGTAENGTGFGGRTQMGYLNIQYYLERLVPTFADASHVVLSGQSAGGFAASLNWIQAMDAWGEDVPVDVLNDSGPPMTEEYLSTCLQQRLAEVWNWSSNIPEGCTECDLESGHVTEPVMRWSVDLTKKRRHALLSNSADSVISLFYSYGLNDCEGIDALFPSPFPKGAYLEGLMALQDDIFADHPGTKAFVVEGTSHVLTSRSIGSVESNGVQLSDWLQEFIDDDPAWESVWPETTTQ